MERFYPIGTPGSPWNDDERDAWLDARIVQRSYREDVLNRVESVGRSVEGASSIEITEYGRLSFDLDRYPLVAVRIEASVDDAPWALITGGVHGYETSGVHGALAFLERHTVDYRDRVNLLIAPCVSPWGYEVVNRWNPSCLDPNRSFFHQSPSEEAASLMNFVADSRLSFLVHMDLHETTDSDETEFRPASAARDGTSFDPGSIPDGFYTVGDTANPQPEFQAAVIAGVEAVTHIAPADEAGQIIGSDVTQHGVINYDLTALGLCASITGARYTTTTEVYPDSPSATPEECIEAQVAAVRAGLDFALS